MEVYGVVYLIWNQINGKRYVGKTIQTLPKRMNQHLHDNLYVDKAIRKYGIENFRYGVIKTCATKEELDECERYFIAALKSKSPYGYNLTDGGDGGTGRECSPETSAKLSAALRGEKNPRYGKKNTPEHQAKIVASHLGKKTPPETCAKIAEALTGNPFTIERCANISVAKRTYSPYKNLVAELDARQMSYAALAKLLGLSAGKVSMKMRCERNFTAKDKAKLVEIFGKPIEYLLEREVCTDAPKISHARCPFKNLVAELDARQMSYTALSKLLGLSDSAVCARMRGERNFTERDKAKLVEIFGKPIEYLLARDDG